MSRGPGEYQQRILTILAGRTPDKVPPQLLGWWPMSALATEVQRQTGQVNRAMLRRSVRSLTGRGLVKQTRETRYHDGSWQHFICLTEAGSGYQKTRQMRGTGYPAAVPYPRST